MGVLAYLLWSRWRRRKQRDQTKRSYAAPAPRVHSPAPRPGLRQLDGTRAEPRDSPISVKMSHSPFRQSTVQVSPAPTPSPSLGAATNAARFVTRVDPSGRERTGGVERFTTTSPNHRRRSLDAQGRPTDGGGGVTCATRVRTVVSPPSSSDAMGRYAAQPSRAGGASSPSELRPRPKRAPPLDANTSGAPSGAGASSTPPVLTTYYLLLTTYYLQQVRPPRRRAASTARSPTRARASPWATGCSPTARLTATTSSPRAARPWVPPPRPCSGCPRGAPVAVRPPARPRGHRCREKHRPEARNRRRRPASTTILSRYRLRWHYLSEMRPGCVSQYHAPMRLPCLRFLRVSVQCPSPGLLVSCVH